MRALCRAASRCASTGPTVEHDLIDDIRWWSLPELMTTADRVFPPGLVSRLPPLLAGRMPKDPERIPWK